MSKEDRVDRITGGRRMFGQFYFRNLHIREKSFEGASFGFGSNLRRGKYDVAENVVVEDCRYRNCILGASIIRVCTLKNIQGDLLMGSGVLMDRVSIVGRFGSLMLHGDLPPRVSSAEKASHNRFKAEFYAGVSWALDISGAEFDEFVMDSNAVPLDLMRLDPDTQVVVRNSRDLFLFAQNELAISDYSRGMIKRMNITSDECAILVAPKGDKRLFAQVMDDIKKLREGGFVL